MNTFIFKPEGGWTDEQFKAAKDLYAEGKTDSEIGLKVGKTTSAVSALRLKHKLPPHKSEYALLRLTSDEDAILRELFAEGLTDPQIADKMGRQPVTVMRARQRLRLSRKKLSAGLTMSEKLDREISNEEKSWNNFWERAQEANLSYLLALEKHGYEPLTNYVESDMGRSIPRVHVELYSMVGSSSDMCAV